MAGAGIGALTSLLTGRGGSATAQGMAPAAATLPPRPDCQIAFQQEIVLLSELLNGFHKHDPGTREAIAFAEMRRNPGSIAESASHKLSFERWSAEGNFVLRDADNRVVIAVRTGVSFDADGQRQRGAFCVHRGEFKATTGDYDSTVRTGLKASVHLDPGPFDHHNNYDGDLSRFQELTAGVRAIRELLANQFDFYCWSGFLKFGDPPKK